VTAIRAGIPNRKKNARSVVFMKGWKTAYGVRFGKLSPEHGAEGADTEPAGYKLKKG
jgi:hypothetical protein